MYESISLVYLFIGLTWVSAVVGLPAAVHHFKHGKLTRKNLDRLDYVDFWKQEATNEDLGSLHTEVSKALIEYNREEISWSKKR